MSMVNSGVKKEFILLNTRVPTILLRVTPLFSHQDNDIDITRIDPPFRHRSIGQVKALTAQALMPLSVMDDKEYYISVPHGHLIQKQVGDCRRV